MNARGVQKISADILHEVHPCRKSFEACAECKLQVSLRLVNLRLWKSVADHLRLEARGIVVGNEEDTCQ